MSPSATEQSVGYPPPGYGIDPRFVRSFGRCTVDSFGRRGEGTAIGTGGLCPRRGRGSNLFVPLAPSRRGILRISSFGSGALRPTDPWGMERTTGWGELVFGVKPLWVGTCY